MSNCAWNYCPPSAQEKNSSPKSPYFSFLLTFCRDLNKDRNVYILRRWIYRLKSDPWKERPVFSSSVDISHRGTSHRCNLQDASLAHTQQEKKDISHLGEGCWERSHLRRRPPWQRRRQRRVGQSNLATGDGRRYRPLYPLSSIRVDHSLDHPSPFYYSPYHDTVTLLSTHGDRPSCRVPLLFILTLLLPLLVHHCLST